jgi:hypothetical protein
MQSTSPAKRMLNYVNAGHDPPLVLRPKMGHARSSDCPPLTSQRGFRRTLSLLPQLYNSKLMMSSLFTPLESQRRKTTNMNSGVSRPDYSWSNVGNHSNEVGSVKNVFVLVFYFPKRTRVSAPAAVCDKFHSGLNFRDNEPLQLIASLRRRVADAYENESTRILTCSLHPGKYVKAIPFVYQPYTKTRTLRKAP